MYVHVATALQDGGQVYLLTAPSHYPVAQDEGHYSQFYLAHLASVSYHFLIHVHVHVYHQQCTKVYS